MFKLCRWIYELGYKKGKADGRQEVYDEKNMSKKFLEILEEDKEDLRI